MAAQDGPASPGGRLDWDDLRFALAVADAGGLSAAGRALRVDPATIGRRLDGLEASLRCKLFHRRRQGLVPTPAGAKLIAHARRIEEEVRAVGFEMSAEDRGLAGIVVITTTDPIAAGFIAPALPAFEAKHPGIAVEVKTDIRTLDLGRREADIALRLARPTQGDLRGRKLGQVGYGLYASRDYLDRRGLPSSGFGSHLLIDWPVDYTIIPQVPWLRRLAAEATVVLRSNSAMTRRAAAASGAGIALLPSILADLDPALVSIPSEAPPKQDLWLVTHRDLARVPRIRVTLEFLADLARRSAKRLRGD
ncbi:MAG: LysR family transcriptional regulator [Alphaproteobacteria bacterium]|nr:LysR family transcriptional regulator [Alphaproteobacteria bacterium]